MNVYFLLFKIFEQLALSLKNRVALEFFTVLKYILLFRIFEELAVALKTEFALKFVKPGGAAAPPLSPASYAYESAAHLSWISVMLQATDLQVFKNESPLADL